MINSAALLTELRRLLRVLETDLRVRIGEQAKLSESLQAEWKNARDAGRTGITYTEWLDEEITQAAVHWVLCCVYLRFLEDNHYLERPYLAGPDQERLALARDRHEQYFKLHPTESDREYLLSCFRDVAQLPAMRGLFDERHNPVFRIGLAGDGAMQLLEFWQKVNPDTGLLIHDFSDPASATRFLGDLYQDLSETARKRYALLQTPVFVEEFILDRTLTPALDEFGYREVRLIDPTCGSGHFLLGAFQRLFDLWARNEPARNLGDLVQKAMDGVYGVDLNPYAVAIARFRLLISALKACGVTRLKDAPAFRINLATGDSLLHGRRFNQLDLSGEAQNLARSGLAHAYQIEDLDEVNLILDRQYHVVVGNPPYITVKDTALNSAYRARYESCYRAYSLGVPFTERFFELAILGKDKQPAGFVGMITTNTFMKREFGSKLIEVVLPRVDLTHVIDTAGAYIPGHGTPTVILFGRNRRPVASTVRTVMGIKGEPSTPADPARGLVWRAIVEQVDRPGSESIFVSVSEMARTTFGKHPWSIGGGGAAELRDALERDNLRRLRDVCTEIGFGAVTREDDAYLVGDKVAARKGITAQYRRPLVEGDVVRDWSVTDATVAIWPYDEHSLTASASKEVLQFLWPYRITLQRRVAYGNSQLERGLQWFEYSMFFYNRYRIPKSIAFAFVATHNHFVFDNSGKVFNRSAPVIKFPRDFSEDAHIGLLGLLNSSLACFWLKQVCHNKGSTVDDKGARQRTDAFEDFYEFTGTKLAGFPLATPQPVELARCLDELARMVAESMPNAVLARGLPTRALLDEARDRVDSARRRMVGLQEELDWCCYRIYGLLDAPLEVDETARVPEIELGERAFEIVLARGMTKGDEISWFARHGSKPISDVPAHWSDSYRQLVEQRIALIEADRDISLIERPENKRRWNSASWHELEQAALRSWLLDRLEAPHYWQGEPHLKSVAKLADAIRLEADFMQVAELCAGRNDFDATALIAELVEGESVPFLPVLRYAESGLRKRAEWEVCWSKQRDEDAADAAVAAATPRQEDESEDAYGRRLATEQKQRKAREVGDIPVPPKYKSADFLNTAYWRLRGGLDVPKERFVSYPHCSRDADGSLVIAWAGWNHLQQATALASYYLDMKENEGWSQDRLRPLLAGLLELVPWLKQWHNEYNSEHATRMGDYFDSFVVDEARSLGFTLADLRDWKPPGKLTAGLQKKKKATVS
jgi:hypothetical protein